MDTILHEDAFIIERTQRSFVNLRGDIILYFYSYNIITQRQKFNVLKMLYNNAKV